MAHSIKGDLLVSRTVDAARRANQGALTKNLTGAETLDKDSYSWYNFTLTGAQDANLPVGSTLNLGWAVVLNNVDGSDTLTVKDSDAATVKSVLPNRAYRFTCTSISGAGTWHVDFLEEGDLLPVSRYPSTFNATSDWTDAAPYYTRTISAATHGMGVNPTMIVQELDGSDYFTVTLDECLSAANGDITMQVTKVPDARFAGRIIVL